jgi:hypothetical protein
MKSKEKSFSFSTRFWHFFAMRNDKPLQFQHHHPGGRMIANTSQLLLSWRV